MRATFYDVTKTVQTKMVSLTAAVMFLLGGIVVPVLAVQPALAAGTVTVTGNTSAGENQPGWMFNRDVSTSTPYEFNVDQASIGNGSLYVKPIGANPTDKFIAEDFLLTPVANLNSFSYDFRIGSGGTAASANQFYMSVYANFGSSATTKFYDCRYNVIASVGSTGAFTTLSFDPTQSYPVTTRAGGDPSPHACPTSPAAMDSLSPGSTIRVVAINVGDTTASDVGLDAYLDNVVVNTVSDGVTTYDFDPAIPACAAATNGNFEGFSTGSVNGQGGWSSTGPYDQSVVHNTYGYATNDCKSLRMSNAVTSGSFGDQTFSFSTPNEAGETSAEGGGMSGGTRQTRFEAQWDFASTTPAAEQPGLAITASPDRGDGARMGWIQMTDTPTGLAVNVFDYESGTGFVSYPNVASGLDRTVPHQLKVIMDFVDGPDNDVVRIYVDGALVHTGNSWEDYFREQELNPTRTVDSILFRASGTAAPATNGEGFLFDNLTIATSTPDTTAPNEPVASPPAGVYTSAQSVSLSSSDSGGSGLANIYYTTDGSTPTNASTVYSGPISVTTGLTLKAIAYDGAGNASPVMVANYVIDSSSGSGGSGGGSGSTGSDNGATNTASSVGGPGAGAGGFGAGIGQIFGDATAGETTTNDENQGNVSVAGSSTDKAKKSEKDTKNSSNFLGLGWWWLLIFAAILAALYAWYRQRQAGNEA